MPSRQFETTAPAKAKTTPARRAEEPSIEATQQTYHATPTFVASGAGDNPRAQAAALAHATNGHLARVGAALLQLQHAYGNRHVQQVVKHAQQTAIPAPIIQTKLVLGPASDLYEREADRVAQQVTSGRSHSVTGEGERVRRTPAIQPLHGAAGGAIDPGMQKIIQGARGGGQPLPKQVCDSMEQALGADFSGVRLHTDAQADRLNHALQARAFTTGRDIFFRRGEYSPSSANGRQILAHELTHVVQQSHIPSSHIQRLLDEDFKHAGQGTEEEVSDCKKFAREVSKLVDQAYSDLIRGNVAEWQGKKITTFLDLLLRRSKAAVVHAGNAIEERVYKLMKQTDLSLSWTPQFSKQMGGSSFPDIVINLPSGKEALIDITSDRKHIYKKAGGWMTSQTYIYVAEAYFPSVLSDQLDLIREGVRNDGLDDNYVNQQYKKIELAREARAKEKKEKTSAARKELKTYGSFKKLAENKFNGDKKAATQWMYQNSLGIVKGMRRKTVTSGTSFDYMDNAKRRKAADKARKKNREKEIEERREEGGILSKIARWITGLLHL